MVQYVINYLKNDCFLLKTGQWVTLGLYYTIMELYLKFRFSFTITWLKMMKNHDFKQFVKKTLKFI